MSLRVRFYLPLTEALVSTGLVEAEEEMFDNAKYTAARMYSYYNCVASPLVSTIIISL